MSLKFLDQNSPDDESRSAGDEYRTPSEHSVDRRVDGGHGCFLCWLDGHSQLCLDPNCKLVDPAKMRSIVDSK